MTSAIAEKAPAALNLNHDFPRSPNATLGVYVLLPRIIDKCRAVLAGTQAGYKFNCSLDQQFFGFVGIEAEAFKQAVAEGLSDEALLDWVQAHQSKPRSEDELLLWARELRFSDLGRPAALEAKRREVIPHKPYIRSWVELLDAEEGRL